MSNRILQRTFVVLSAAIVGLTMFAVASSVSGAAQSRALLPTKQIVISSDKDLSAIRTFFFCQTAKCKKSSSTNKVAAASALSDIKSEIKLMKADSVPQSQAAIVAKYQVDATALIEAFTAYPKQPSADDVSNNIGIIYYQTSNLGSDDYLLGCAQTKTTVIFKNWSVGVVAVAYAMQVDTRAVTTSTPPATIKAVNQSLLAEAVSMRSDANGPNAAFNRLLVQFSSTQALDSYDSLLILSGRGKSLTIADMKALASKLSSQFKLLSTMQNKLAK